VAFLHLQKAAPFVFHSLSSSMRNIKIVTSRGGLSASSRVHLRSDQSNYRGILPNTRRELRDS